MKILFPPTLSWYFIRLYGLNFLILLTGLLAVIYIFDVVELLRRSARSDEVTLSLVLTMGLYKLPEVGQMIFPFAILFSAMWTFWQLTKRHELVIIRSSGMSVWQFILPIILAAFIIGLLQLSVVSPMGALFVSKFEQMESRYLNKKSSAISLSEQGLWLRQDFDSGRAILHAEKVTMPSWILRDVTVYYFNTNNDFIKRLDSQSAYLKDNAWHFNYAVTNSPGQIPIMDNKAELQTELTIGELESSFSSPETISFWKLPAYIKVMEQTGFDSTPLKIHFQTLLAQPFLFMAMILLAATVSLRQQRMKGSAFLVFSGITIGFVIFFASSFLSALGATAQIPIFVAAWFPAIISILAGIGAMMIMEDG